MGCFYHGFSSTSGSCLKTASLSQKKKKNLKREKTKKNALRSGQKVYLVPLPPLRALGMLQEFPVQCSRRALQSSQHFQLLQSCSQLQRETAQDKTGKH